jgi:molybdopterin converting factor small subunit
MNIKVLLFAEVRERAGAHELELTLEDGISFTGSDLKQKVINALLDRCGDPIKDLVDRSMLAIDSEYVMDLTEPLVSLDPRAEVAIIPPISGG